MAIEKGVAEKYLVRVQLINVWEGQEKVTRSFDYEVSPMTDIIEQRPLFMRAEEFYNKLQTILKGTRGTVTITGQESLKS